MKTLLVTCAALLMLAACGGGGSTTTPAAGNAALSVSTSGTITAFGSVFVNGVRYDVSGAALKKNGRSVAQSQLAVGEVALVHGRQDLASGQGSADSVEVEDNVVGPVAAISADGTQLTALGQAINVTASTSFASNIVPADVTGLKPGDVIEVSGLAAADGAIAATRIGRAPADEALQVLGTVSALDSGSHVFHVNGLTIDYTTAALSGFTNGQPAHGDLVVARGTQFDATAVRLTATVVERAHTDPTEDADGQHAATGRVEVEGLVTNFNSAADFEVAGVKVSATDATVYEHGSAADLANNARVEVRGTLDANKVLQADRIEIGHVAALMLVAPAAQVDSTSTPNTLQLLGVAVAVDASTRFEDKSSAAVQMFTLKDVHDGDTVAVRGYESPAGSGRLLARELERLPASTQVAVRGPYTATTAPQFMILGVTIDATSANFGHVEEGGSMTSADFFAQAAGQIVEVRGTAAGSTISATQVAIDSIEDR